MFSLERVVRCEKKWIGHSIDELGKFSNQYLLNYFVDIGGIAKSHEYYNKVSHSNLTPQNGVVSSLPSILFVFVDGGRSEWCVGDWYGVLFVLFDFLNQFPSRRLFKFDDVDDGW